MILKRLLNINLTVSVRLFYAIMPVENVEFSVYSDTTGELVTKGVTDKEGYLKFADLPYDIYTAKDGQVNEIVSVKYLDQETKTTQLPQYELTLESRITGKL